MRIIDIAHSATSLWAWAVRKNTNAYGHPSGNAFADYSRNFKLQTTPESTQAYYLGLDLLEIEGTQETGIEPGHVSVLNTTLEICREQNLPTTGLAANFSRLINEGVSSNALAMYSYAALYFLESDIDTNLDRNFLRLAKLNPSEKEWELYELMLSEQLNSHFGKLTEAYADLLELKLSEREFKTLQNLVQCSKTDYIGVKQPFFKTLEAYKELVSTKPNDKEWEVFSQLLEYQQGINYYLGDLITYFAQITALKPSKQELKTLQEVCKIPMQHKQEVHTEVNSFKPILKTKPNGDELEAYKLASKYCYEFGWALNVLSDNFAKLISAKATKDQLKIYTDIIGEEEQNSNKFNILHFTTAFAIVARAHPTEVQLRQFIEDELFRAGDLNGSCAPGYYDLIAANPTQDIWARFNKLIDYHKEHKLPFQQFVGRYAALVAADPSDEIWNLYDELIARYIEAQLPLILLTGSLNRLAEDDPTKLILDVYREATLLHLCFEDQLFINSVQDYCVKLMQENAHPTLLNNYIKAARNGHLKTREDSKNLLRDLTIHAAITNLLRNQTTRARVESRGVINAHVQNDPLPYALKDADGEPNPDAVQAQKETESVFRRAINMHHGFGALTVDCKRNPTGEPWTLARFGNDIAEFTEFINAQSPIKFPGKGVQISKLIPERIFAFNEDDWREYNDPYYRYKVAWPWAAEEFDDLSHTQFVFTRGFAAVMCPTSPKYILDDQDGRKVHYSYIVFNDHHENYGCDVAYLVPTEILKSKLWGTTIPYGDYLGFSKEDTDINDVPFSPKDLIEAAKVIPANVLNLCWGSNIGGGLCNAYPPGSRPFHRWESKRKMRHETRDKYNHVHKSHITGQYQSSMTKKMDRKLEPLRHAHKQVFEVTNKYQNLLDLFKLTLAMWHKGHTIGEKVIPAGADDDFLFDTVDYNETEQVLEQGEIYDMSDNPNANRMLIEAYKWYEGRKVGRDNKNDFPILVIADTLDYWSIPKSPMLLDTYDLTITIDGETIQLPRSSDGTGEIENDIWYNNVIPYIQSTAKDLRFYDRRELGIAVSTIGDKS